MTVTRRRSRRGHTLLEILLALGLSLILLSAAYSALDLHWRYSAAGQLETERSQVARALLEQMARDIRGATLDGITGDDNELCLQLWEAAPMQDGSQPGEEPAEQGLRTVCWRIQTGDAETARLVRSERAADNGDPLPDLIAEEVQTLRFLYFDGRRWVEDWNDQVGRPPRAVEIVIGFGEDGLNKESARSYRLVVATPPSGRRAPNK